MKMLKKLINDLLRTFITNVSGSTGRRIRYLYYRKKFKKCGTNVAIDEGVVIENPEFISIGNNVWIDKYTILIAGKTDLSKGRIKQMENNNYKASEGELIIGDGVHIGNFNVLQAHAGVVIGSFITTSSGVKIYSLSNYPFNEEISEEITYANCMVGDDKTVSYICSPIVIEDGVWLAMNCSVVGGTIGKNSFIVSNSVVLKDIPANSYASGNPAVKIKERFKTKVKL